MAHRRDKEDNEKIYSSQPVTKSARWTDDVWRRLRKPPTVTSGSSSSVPENPSLQNKDAGLNQEEKKWSKDAVEFYNNGDASFCYTKFLPMKQLNRSFWGNLLGYESNGNLSETHIEAWTTRLMIQRYVKLRVVPYSRLRWTVLPPCFYDEMMNEDSKTAIELAGEKWPYPRFWEVDVVYIPLDFHSGNWLLVRIDMRTLEITQYWTDKRWRNKKLQSCKMEMLSVFFPWFLDRIRYWRNSDIMYDTKQMFLGLSEVNVPQDNGNVANSGVLVCMMIEMLVKKKPLLIENDVEEACVTYRHHMAQELYKWRVEPDTV